jgi:hypothetical protein
VPCDEEAPRRLGGNRQPSAFSSLESSAFMMVGRSQMGGYRPAGAGPGRTSPLSYAKMTA